MEQGLDATWRKSSYSGGNGGSCVEVGGAAGAIYVRDTKDPQRKVAVSVPTDAWSAFLATIK